MEFKSDDPLIGCVLCKCGHSKCGHNKCNVVQHPFVQFREVHPHRPQINPVSIPGRSQVFPKSTQKNAFAMTTSATTTYVSYGDLQRADGQGDAEAHSKTHRAPQGAPRGEFCWTLASPWPAARCNTVHRFSELALRVELMLSKSAIRCPIP